jgi:hypothetical protein
MQVVILCLCLCKAARGYPGAVGSAPGGESPPLTLRPRLPLPPPSPFPQEYTAEIDKFNAQGTPEAEEGTGTLTPEEEEALKKKIKRGNMKMAKDRHLLATGQAKLAAFQEALHTVRTATGYEDLQDIIDLFNKYEDEKFNKVGAANRMVRGAAGRRRAGRRRPPPPPPRRTPPLARRRR